ncbi:FMN binding protein [Aureococcus anophagefferens]|nr:FMN binding protein [Aureococcus anophagefferens]
MAETKQASLQQTYARHMARRRSQPGGADAASERGYDPLDSAFREARLEGRRGATHAGETTRGARRRRVKLREILKEHLVVMHEHGLVFEHTFRAGPLGFGVALARYGPEGRVFARVERTERGCALYPDALKPSDELIALDGDLLVDPTPAEFDALRETLATAAPATLLFVKGEKRDAAFADQERDRGAARLSSRRPRVRRRRVFACARGD